MSDKRKTREYAGPLWNEIEDPITWDMEKAEMTTLPQSSLASAPATPPKSQTAKAGTT